MTFGFISGLRELTLKFYAPLRYRVPLHSADRSRDIYALPIDLYLEGFYIDRILGLTDLQKITIVGVGGYRNRNKVSFPHPDLVVQDDTVEQLSGVLNMGRHIKNGFKKQNRDVVVKIRMLYGRTDEVEEILK
jgi:hypothetical protein